MPELPAGSPPTPVTPIGDVAGWQFRIWCGRCRRKVMIDVATIIERQGPRVPIYQVVDRFRCHGGAAGRQCGGSPGAVMLAEVWKHGKSARVVREIDVLPMARGTAR
jgi:hypothetical protein